MNINFCQTDNMHSGKKHSCETQLITVINDWATILDKGGQVDTFILDFEKALDTSLHELLKCTLYGYQDLYRNRKSKFQDFSRLFTFFSGVIFHRQ